MPRANARSNRTSTNSMPPPPARRGASGGFGSALNMAGRQNQGYSHEGFRWHLLQMVISTGITIDSVVGPHFRALMSFSPYPIEFPEKEELENDLEVMYDLARKRLKNMLSNENVAMHVGLGARAARQLPTLLEVNLHWCPAGTSTLKRALLDFVGVPLQHPSERLAPKLIKVMKDWNIEEKWLATIGDNTTTEGEGVTDFLPELLPSNRGQSARVRDIADILNLAAQAFLRPFELSTDHDSRKVRTKLVNKRTGEVSKKRKREMKDDESLKEEVEVKKMKEGSPTMQDDSFSIKADEDSSSYDATIKTEQGKLEQVKKEEVEMDMGAPSSSSSSSVPVLGDEWEEVPLTYDEELEVVFREEGLIDETLENPFRIIARYISLEDELKLTDDDCGARVDLGEKALQDLIEEVETINEQTIRELGKLSSDQKQPGTFMLLKIKGLAADLQRRLDKDEDDDYIAQCCSSKNKADGVTTLLEAVRTKWITHLHAIARYVELKRAVIRLTTGANYATLGLEKFVLKPAEWSLAEELIPVYHAFKDCFVSLAKGDAPLVHQTIPIIRTLRERLAAIVNNDAASQIIRHGASNVIKVLEKFYPETGGSDMYTIAMILHPRFKLEWFRAKGCDQEWIDQAVGTVRGIWEKYYLPNVVAPESDSHAMDIEAYEQPSPRVDPLTQYLSEPTFKTSDPLAYWKTQEEARLVEPQLIKMAKDYLSAPATIVNVNHVFSLAKEYHPEHDDFPDAYKRKMTLLDSWLELGLVTEQESTERWKRERRERGPEYYAAIAERVSRQAQIDELLARRGWY